MLIWKERMPEDKIWLKIGGDHGENSFKICLQVNNLEKPNAKQNTMVIASMPAKDLHENLKNLTAIYKDHFTGKRKRLGCFFLEITPSCPQCMDYKVQRGHTFCLWCINKPEDIRFPSKSWSPATQRTLVALKHDHTQFIKKGSGKINLASCSHNVCREPLWNNKINQTCPPYLHILLGIVTRHHDLLEKERREVMTC